MQMFCFNTALLIGGGTYEPVLKTVRSRRASAYGTRLHVGMIDLVSQVFSYSTRFLLTARPPRDSVGTLTRRYASGLFCARFLLEVHLFSERAGRLQSLRSEDGAVWCARKGVPYP